MMRRRWRCGGLAVGRGVRESSESPPPADICWRRRGRGVRFDLPSGGDPSPVAASLELLSFFFFLFFLIPSFTFSFAMALRWPLCLYFCFLSSCAVSFSSFFFCVGFSPDSRSLRRCVVPKSIHLFFLFTPCPPRRSAGAVGRHALVAADHG